MTQYIYIWRKEFNDIWVKNSLNYIENHKICHTLPVATWTLCKHENGLLVAIRHENGGNQVIEEYLKFHLI